MAANHRFYGDDEPGPGLSLGVGGDRRGRTEITLRLLPVHRPRETQVGSRTRGYSNNANRIHKNPNKEKQVLWGSPGTEQGRQRPAGQNEGKNRPRLPACSWAWWPAQGPELRAQLREA